MKDLIAARDALEASYYPRVLTMIHTQACFESYLGLWLMEPTAARTMAEAWRSGMLAARDPLDSQSEQEASYAVSDGVAIVQIHGSMGKHPSKLGGTSTLISRRQLMRAERDPAVRGVMLHVDSPGGMVAGTDELAEQVRKASKPVHAYIEDTGASAAYWVASQAGSISVNRMGMVGSVGVFMVIEDDSAAAEAKGVKVHVVSSGPYKGAGVPGAPVTDEHLAYAREGVDATAQGFFAAVGAGRQLDADRLGAVTDGRMFAAVEARRLGLVDHVESFETALGRLRRETAKGDQRRQMAARLELAGL